MNLKYVILHNPHVFSFVFLNSIPALIVRYSPPILPFPLLPARIHRNVVNLSDVLLKLMELRNVNLKIQVYLGGK